jgi:hypothetical protein
MRKALFAAILFGAALAARADGVDEARRRKGEVLAKAGPAAIDPGEALFAAAELSRAGGELYETLFSRGLRSDRAAFLATQEGADRSARAVAGHLLIRAGRGLPLSASPLARPDFERRIAAIAARAGLDPVPAGLAPVYAVSTERAEGAAIGSGALGFGLLAAVRLGVRLAASSDAAERFEGSLLLFCAAAEIEALPRLVCDGKGVVPAATFADYDPYGGPRYFARLYAVRDAEAPLFAVEDATSRLADAAAILLGAAEYARAGAAGDSQPARPAERRPELFPKEVVKTARDLVRLSFRNMAALHFDAGAGRLAFMAEARPGEKTPRTVLFDAALALLALEAAAETFPDDPGLRGEARKLAASQSDFFLARMRGTGGALLEEIDFASKKTAPASGSLAGEALAVRGLAAAARLTGEARFAEAARELARALERRWDPWASLYLGEPSHGGPFVLAPRDGAALLSMLGDLVLGGVPEAADRLVELEAGLARVGALPRAEDGACAAIEVEVRRP